MYDAHIKDMIYFVVITVNLLVLDSPFITFSNAVIVQRTSLATG